MNVKILSNGTVTAACIYVFVLLTLGVGWILNIISIIKILDGPVNAMFIARCVGVIAWPLGGVLGWF